MPSAVRLHQALLAAAVLVPAALFAAAAWHDRAEILREGADTVARTTAIMHEHARKVFETETLLLSLVEERVAELPPDQVVSPATGGFLRRVKAPLEQAVSVWVAGPDGTIEAGSQDWDRSTGIGEREFFQIHKRVAAAGTYVSEAFTGKATNIASFAISRRRNGPGGAFAGTVHVAASPAYFTQFYREAAPPLAHLAMLLRADGAVLAQEPEMAEASARLDPRGVLMSRIAASPAVGAFQAARPRDGVERLYAYRKVDAYPVYVVFGLDRAALLRRWREDLRDYGAVAAAAAATLLLVSVLALRRAQAEEAALRELRRETAQRQAAEAQLRHSQRLDAIGQLTGGVAHDFNNLLTVMMGNLELIERAARAVPGEAGRRVVRLAGLALEAGRRGVGLTRSLLAFARRQPLQAADLDVNALLAEFMPLVRQAVGTAVTATFDPAPDLPPCRTDPAQLESAVLNLAINARDAMPAGGTLRVSTGLAALDAADLAGNAEAQPGRFVTVTAADTGTGMAPEVVVKAFEPFFTTKPAGQGTGLGLSQVFGFARQLGGHVAIRSAPGQGTAITLFLPASGGLGTPVPDRAETAG